MTIGKMQPTLHPNRGIHSSIPIPEVVEIFRLHQDLDYYQDDKRALIG